jgi:hypothetical protein
VHLDLVAEANLGPEVDLDVGEDDRPELAEGFEACLLEISGVDGVVHVSDTRRCRGDAPVRERRRGKRSLARCYRGAMWAILGGLGAAVSWAITSLTAPRGRAG